jgi:hypothetical protein
MSGFTPVNIFDFKPKFPGSELMEPALRDIILSYYRLFLPTEARKHTEEYVAQILEAYFGISRSD